MIPSIAIFHIRTPDWRGFRLWIPLFLVWVLLLPFSPLLLLGYMLYCLICRVNVWEGLAAIWEVLCAISGTDVLVDSEGTQVLLRLI